MSRSVKQDVIGIVIIAGFVAAAICHYVNTVDFHFPYPYSTFLFRPDDQFMDWFKNARDYFDPYRTRPSAEGVLVYFPFVYTITSIITLAGYWPSFWIVTVSFVGFFVAYMWRPLRAKSVFGTIRNVLIYTFFSYPVLFTLDRANLEMWTFIFSGCFLLFYQRKWYYAAATVLALSVACKPFGLVLIVLLLLDRRFLAACYAIGLAVALDLASLFLFKGTFHGNLAAWLGNLENYQRIYVIADQGFPFAHSLFGMWKYIYYLSLPQYVYGWGSNTPAIYMAAIYSMAAVYKYVAAALGSALCGFIFWRRKSLELWEIVGLLVVAEVWLPYVSTDYTLLQCYLPMLLFIESDRRSRSDWVIAILFGLLMIPKQYQLMAGTEPGMLVGTEVGIGVLINPILLLALAGTIVFRPLLLPLAEIYSASVAPGTLWPAHPAIGMKMRVLVLSALVLAAGCLRFTGTSFGLPQHYRPDEDESVPYALGFEDDWNPHFVAYPAAQFYLLHGIMRAYATASGGGRDLHAVFDADNLAPAVRVSRYVSAAMGTATVAAFYLAAEPVFGPTAALASAAVVTVMTLHVRESKFAKMQVPAGLWLALAIAMMLRIVYRGRLLDYALAGFFAGLAAATHYGAGAIVVGILVAHFEARHREHRPLLSALGDVRIYAAGVMTALTFFCATPYFFLDFAQTIHWYILNQAWGPGWLEARGWWWILMHAVPDSIGVSLMAFMLVSIVWAIFRPRPGVIALLAFIVASFLSLIIGNPPLFFRYVLNPLLAMALLAGLLAADLIGFASARLGSRRGVQLGLILLAVILAPSLIHDIQLDRLLLETDTRTLAGQWIAEHIPEGTVIAVTDFGNLYGKPPVPARCQIVEMPDVEWLRTSNISWVIADSLPNLPLYSPGPTEEQLAELNSDATLLFDLDPVKEGAPAPVFDPNDAFYVPFRHIRSMERPGPRIRIWRLNPETQSDVGGRSAARAL